jgi:hypothetical protein
MTLVLSLCQNTEPTTFICLFFCRNYHKWTTNMTSSRHFRNLHYVLLSVKIHILQVGKRFIVFVGLPLLHSVFLLKNIFILQSSTDVERMQ